MFGRSRPFRIDCDAPPYGVVRACAGCGFHSPLDVRWCRLGHFHAGGGQRQEHLGVRLWQWLCRKRRPEARATCTCGQPLPDLKKYRFAVLSEKVGDYFLGQCPRCRMMFWDEALPLPAWMAEGVSG
jgi:hypothetical protein